MLCLAQREVHTDVNDVTERRRGFRISQSRPVRVFDPANGCFIAGETRNVSASGLQIRLPLASDVRAGSTLNVAVAGNNGGMNRSGLIAARVIWTHLSFETGLTAGIEFITGAMSQRFVA